MGDGPRPGRPEAAAAIWDGPRGDPTAPRRFAWWGLALRLGMVGVVVGALYWLGRPLAGNVLAGLGLAGVVAGWVWPGPVRRLEGWLARGVGGLLAWLLLTPFFYLVITPFGLMFRRGGRDRLGRGVDPAVPTYWRDRDRQPSLDEPY